QYIGDPDKDYANHFSILKSVMTELRNIQAQLAAANKELEALRTAPLVTAVQTPVLAAAAHLPPLTSLHMKDWFRQAEAQFAYKGITSERTKFYYVTSCLDSSIKCNLREEDKDPVDPEAYQTIKRVILTQCRPPPTPKLNDLSSLWRPDFSIPSQLMLHFGWLLKMTNQR
ncbi:Uncharacterized protein FKW44_012037, partial [Caligus rogercresseyi]